MWQDEINFAVLGNDYAGVSLQSSMSRFKRMPNLTEEAKKDVVYTKKNILPDH